MGWAAPSPAILIAGKGWGGGNLCFSSVAIYDVEIPPPLALSGSMGRKEKFPAKAVSTEII